MSFREVQIELVQIMDQEKEVEQALEKVCATINRHLSHYDWVGFYFMDHQSQMLHLGPYVGEATDHVKIPFGKGICGQVAESGQPFLVDDVKAQDNYIACSIDVRSEIVVPMYWNKTLIGQIDIDSHKEAAFNAKDEAFLVDLCVLLSQQYGSKLNEFRKGLIASRDT